MKRILLVLTVAIVMAAMMVGMAAGPGLAAPGNCFAHGKCKHYLDSSGEDQNNVSGNGAHGDFYNSANGKRWGDNNN